MTREDDVQEDQAMQINALKTQLGVLQQQQMHILNMAEANRVAAEEARAQVISTRAEMNAMQIQGQTRTGPEFQRALNSIPSFDGKGSALFREHLVNFNSWKTARQINDDEQCKIALSYSLKSAALTRVRGLLPGTTAFKEAKTFQEYSDLISEVFAPRVEKGLSRSEFHAYHQAANEDVGNYVSIKSSLFEIAYDLEERSFQTLRAAMIKGLYSNVIKRTVSRKDSRDAEELRQNIFLAVASEREAYAGGWAESTNLDGLKSVTITNHRGQSRDEPMEIDQLYSKKSGPSQGPHGPQGKKMEARTCHRCQRPGHLKRDCHARTSKDGKKLGQNEPKRGERGDKKKGSCFNCGAYGHRQAECPKRKGRGVNQMEDEGGWNEDDLTAEEIHDLFLLEEEPFLVLSPSHPQRM